MPDPCTLPPSARLKVVGRKLGTHLSQDSFTHRIDRKIHSKMCAKSLRAEVLPFGVSNYISVPECHKNVVSFPDPSPLRPPIMKREREGSGNETNKNGRY